MYFAVFFLVVLSAFSLKAVVYSRDPNVDFTDPGMTSLNSYVSYAGKCDTPTNLDIALIPFGAIACAELDVTNLTCSNIQGCSWENDSFFFGTYCAGLVNRSYYNITSFRPCNATALQDQSMCDIFKCSWSDPETIYTQQVSILSPGKSFSMFWETAKFITGFRTDLGFKQFGWLFALFFTYVPFLMLLFALYMALPFLH
jgi:hypothetical protein